MLVVRARFVDGTAARTHVGTDSARDEHVDETLDLVPVGNDLFSSSSPNNE